jgi:hypothetical protein
MVCPAGQTIELLTGVRLLTWARTDAMLAQAERIEPNSLSGPASADATRARIPRFLFTRSAERAPLSPVL